MSTEHFDIVTVTLNAAIDRTVMIPNFKAGSVNRVDSTTSSPGGKGVNVASLLADAGHRVAVTGFLGCENAAPFEELFARKLIKDRFIRIPGETRVGIKIVDSARHQTTDINFPGPALSGKDVETIKQQLDALDANVFVLAGSLPPGIVPDIYRDLVARLRTRGSRVVLDTSGDALRRALTAKPHLFKPNIHELGELLHRMPGGEQETVAAARQLIHDGIEEVVVSLGQDGAFFVTADEAILVRSLDIPVRSTVGAGDAMVAGIISAYLKKLSLAESARLATAFSLHILTGGSVSADFSTSVESFLPLITTGPV